MAHCNKVGGKRKTQRRRTKQMKGGSSNMAGSPYQGESPAVQQGTPYVAFNLNGNTSEVAGSYAPLSKASHQCGGKRKRRTQQKRKTQRKKSQQKRKTQQRKQKK